MAVARVISGCRLEKRKSVKTKTRQPTHKNHLTEQLRRRQKWEGTGRGRTEEQFSASPQMKEMQRKGDVAVLPSDWQRLQGRMCLAWAQV